MVVAVIILSCLLSCFFIAMLFEFIVIVELSKQINQLNEVIKEEEEHRKTSQELIDKLEEIGALQESNIKSLFNQNIFEKLKYMSTMLITYKLLNEQEAYSNIYNQLYFMGVNKEFLDNEEKMNMFLKDIEEGKYDIKEGEKPFTCKFVLRNDQ